MTIHNPDFGRKNAGARVDDAKEFADVMAALKARDDEIKSFADKATAEIKATGAMAAETKAALEKLSAGGVELQDRLLAVEQKLARRPAGGAVANSLGAQFTDSDDFKVLAAKGRGTARLNIKAAQTITSDTNPLGESPEATGFAGDAIRPDRLPGIITPATRMLTIRDLLMPGRTSSNAIEYVVEHGYTNAAATVAEGASKPQSDLTFVLQTTNVRTIAHWFAASKQVLGDVPALMSYINGRAIYGLKYVEENQLLAGNGSDQNLHGLIPQATDFDTGLSEEGDTAIDTVRRAMLQVRLAEYRATGIVMNPTDWAAIELTKTTGEASSGEYIWANPRMLAGPVLWGLPVVETTAVSEGEFLVGAFNIAAQVFDREDAAIEVSTEHDDFFVKNLVAIRAEERLALAVFRPESFVHGSFS